MSDDATKDAPNAAELPEWGRKAISEANAEAAKYRVKAQTAADEARAQAQAEFDAKYKTVADEKSAITTERDQAVTDLAKLKVALASGVPGETAVAFADLLKGSNEDELKAHAENLKNMFGVSGKSAPAVDLSHGLSGGSSSDPGDAFAALLQSKLTR
ncbi:hypothetical protein [Saccharothrix sp. HUAS TT1]|uniref:hypothetical protein n=1 Tax=unclassified Saccharothrix TaxID=2593673 RepID=UPI00345C0207